MADIAMKVVQHPQLDDVKYSVPAEDVDRWEKQGWKATDDTPTAPAGSAETPEENLTVAQKAGLGLLPVAGGPEPAGPTTVPSAQEAPTAADAPSTTGGTPTPAESATESPSTASVSWPTDTATTAGGES